MSIDRARLPQLQDAGGDEQRPFLTDPSAAWAQLADSFPEWTLDPPFMLEPRRPST